jgi:hypothetical protein
MKAVNKLNAETKVIKKRVANRSSNGNSGLEY